MVSINKNEVSLQNRSGEEVGTAWVETSASGRQIVHIDAADIPEVVTDGFKLGPIPEAEGGEDS